MQFTSVHLATYYVMNMQISTKNIHEMNITINTGVQLFFFLLQKILPEHFGLLMLNVFSHAKLLINILYITYSYLSI